jgi:hypothetical protein
MAGRFCSVGDCVAAAHRDGLCRAHYERKRKGADLGTPLRPRLGSWNEVVDAMHGYFHAETEREYSAAKERVRRAAKAWVKGH